MRVLVTGGFGNLGSWLVKRFLVERWNVTVLARRYCPTFAAAGAVDYLECDVADAEQCEAALRGRAFDAAIHLACASQSTRPSYYREALLVNTLGTRNILEHLDRATLRQVIFFSTAQVYGVGEGVITEETPPAPHNDYSATHWYAEHYVREYERTRAVPCVVLRLSNSYGCPKDATTSQWSLVLNDLARMACLKGEIRLQSNGLAWRDFIWMGDVSEAVVRILRREPRLSGLFNLSSGSSVQLRDLAERVRAAYRLEFGVDVPVRLNEADPARPKEPLVVSSERLKAAIDFQLHDRVEEEARAIFRLVKPGAAG